MRRKDAIAGCSLAVTALLLLSPVWLAGGCNSAEQGSASSSPSAMPSSPSGIASPSSAAATVGSAKAFYAALVKAIRSSDPSMSPDALCQHVRAVTKAPHVLVVSQFDLTEAEDYDSIVASWGTDGSLTMDLVVLIQRAQARPFRSTRKSPTFGTPFFFAGHPLKVAGHDGYVIVAAPAP